MDKLNAKNRRGGQLMVPIQVEALQKSYGDFPAVKGIDFEVKAGEVFGTPRPQRSG